MVYEGADGSAHWEGYWTSPRNPDGAARWEYASHWLIDCYPPNLAEGVFCELLRLSRFLGSSAKQGPRCCGRRIGPSPFRGLQPGVHP